MAPKSTAVDVANLTDTYLGLSSYQRLIVDSRSPFCPKYSNYRTECSKSSTEKLQLNTTGGYLGKSYSIISTLKMKIDLYYI